MHTYILYTQTTRTVNFFQNQLLKILPSCEKQTNKCYTSSSVFLTGLNQIKNSIFFTWRHHQSRHPYTYIYTTLSLFSTLSFFKGRRRKERKRTQTNKQKSNQISIFFPIKRAPFIFSLCFQAWGKLHLFIYIKRNECQRKIFFSFLFSFFKQQRNSLQETGFGLRGVQTITNARQIRLNSGHSTGSFTGDAA